MATNPNMEAIQTVTVGSTGATSIEFTNIPQTYTDLVLKVSLRDTRTDSPVTDTLLTFNNSSSSYSLKGIYSSSPTVGSFSSSGAAYIAGTYENTSQSGNASVFSNSEYYIPNYTSSNNKSVSVDGVTEKNATTDIYMSLVAGLWSNSSPITSIKLVPMYSLSFVQYSTATLYGITAYVGEEGGKAIGGTVTSDSNYYYHTFTTSGNFIPSQSLTADVLVVAGGGSGGADSGGGGGAGGFRTGTGLSLSATSYSVIVGAGGAAPYLTGSVSNYGTNSTFSTITSSGGGRGGDRGSNYPNGTPGGNGGSGGGGGGAEQSPGRPAGTGNSGGYSPSEGNNGGAGTGPAGSFSGGGGGGAGGAGTAASGTTGGNGGIGSSTAISGGSVTGAGQNSGGTYYFAGGGGGGGGGTAGTGGTGGGGNAGTAGVSGTNGTIATGGGGGGAGNSTSTGYGGAGGSGIVIIRYAK
jgi:hypothetical protein